MKRMGSLQSRADWLAHSGRLFSRRSFTIAGIAMLMAGCQVIPKSAAPPPPAPTPEPSATALPADQGRHRIALLLPMTGDAGSVGQTVANATTMALLDTNSSNLRITTYDTAKGTDIAARQAVADGNKLILGPLLADSVPAVVAATRGTNIPAISFSNDTSVAGGNVFVMGHIPEQSIRRTVQYARSKGSNNFAALLPEGDYGQRSLSALENALRDYGGTLAARQSYSRGNTSIISAAGRLRTAGGYDTVLIADGARFAMQAAGELQRGTRARILGTDLWTGDASLAGSASMNGALFSAVSDQRFRRFSESYEARFGAKPMRVATLGYDAVLLTLRVARDWKVGRDFPQAQLYDAGGFLGVDGAFRFGRNGVIERALEVREVSGREVIEVDPAPQGFGG
jgi:branched-chain amino acid transport system substrate-binding protein